MSYYTEHNEWWLTDDQEIILYFALKTCKDDLDSFCKKANIDKKIFNSFFEEVENNYNKNYV